MYFDIDLMARFPVWEVLREDTAFATSWDATGRAFFQAFMASVPHPTARSQFSPELRTALRPT